MIYLMIAMIYSLSVPLGEAPDEIEHMAYIQFIAEHRRLPANLAERTMVGYKAVWPPLYHGLTSLIVSQVDTSSPAPLKKIDFSNPRRLLVYDGLTEINAIHTEDEAFPYQGRFLAWHLARLSTIILGAGVVIATYLIALEIFPGDRTFALGAASLTAFIPRFTFTSAVLNDDNLINLIASLALLIVVRLWKGKYGTVAYSLSGILLGLGLSTKYSALSLGLELIIVTIILSWQSRLLAHLLLLTVSTAVASSWWFGYIEWHFNRIEELGWFAGLLAPLTAGGIETASLRVMSLLSRGTIPTLEGGSAAPWSLKEFALWNRVFFESFWAGFTHLDTGAIFYWVLLALCLLGAAGIVRGWGRLRKDDRKTLPLLRLLLLHLSVFFPLILTRYAFSRKIIESAQGRYLFPALPAISILLLFGLLQWIKPEWRHYATFGVALVFVAFTLISLQLFIMPAYPPLLPVRTTDDAALASHPVDASVGGGAIELVGYELADLTDNGALPVTLVWRSRANADNDYAIDLTLASEDGVVAGRWLGQPVNGHYPSRAWEPGDVVRDVVWLPVRGAHAGDYRLTLRVAPNLSELLPSDGRPPPVSADQTLELDRVTLPDLSQVPPGHLWGIELTPDLKLAGFDLWQASDPAIRTPHLAYRSTIPVRLVWEQGVPDNIELETRLGGRAPLLIQDNLYLFFVGPDWESGPQSLSLVIRQGEKEIESVELDNVVITSVRSRNFEVPPMSNEVRANFGDEIVLLGLDFPQRRVQPGGALPITLYWQAQRSTAQHYTVSNHLLDSVDLRQWGGYDRIPQDYYSTVLWTPGEVVRDDYLVPVDPAAPPGVYRLDLGLYADMGGQVRHLPLVADGHILDTNSVTITPIKVGGPPSGVTVPTPSPQYPRADNLEGLVTLLGYDFSLAPEILHLTLYWQCDAPLSTDYTTFVHVRDATGQVTGSPGSIVAQMDRPPANGAYPTSLWDPGEVIRDSIQVPIPPQVPAGEYEIVVGMYNFRTGRRLTATAANGQLLPDGMITLLQTKLPYGTP
jgi:4-amino-4-deoxy-L-arabinose transferase-like glycosyltransferase